MVSIIISSVVLVLLSSIVNVNSQTCEVTSAYTSCSSNTACGCLPMVQFTEIGICAVLGVSCSQLSPCQLPNNTCENVDHICVRHSRCNSNPLCYPLAMVDPRLCPSTSPLPSTYSTWYTTSTPTAEATITTGSQDFIISNYSDELTYSSEKDPTTLKYFQAIEIMVNTTGTYELSSVSNMDTYACIYQGRFYPTSSVANQLSCNDDSGTNQFKLTPYLYASVSYTLVFTTYNQEVIGPYSIVALGPDYLDFTPINVQQPTTMPTSTLTTSSLLVSSNYSSELTNNSETYFRHDGATPYYESATSSYENSTSSYGNLTSNYYYEAIQVNVHSTGTYTFTSLSDLDAYGCLYNSTFDSSDPSSKLIVSDDDDGGNRQFGFTVFLGTGIPYTLVFTTFGQGETGPFMILASGPSMVEFIPINNL